ncbi:MAG TPA: hypothetical protein VGF04_07225 [Solirubrobacterales bacterium]|jgi:hypothetical protein
MKKHLRGRLTFANVISCIALFVALGGLAVAATKLPKNSVGTKQLKKNSVTTAKIKKNAVTGAKVKKQSLTGSDIKLSTLGTVPTAQLANSIQPAEPTHLVGAPGEPPFEGGSGNVPPLTPGISLPPVGFYKDREGIVHLEGFAKVGAGGPIFTLPPGYQPAPGQLREYQPIDETAVIISGINFETLHVGSVLGSTGEAVSLEGISFRPGA